MLCEIRILKIQYKYRKYISPMIGIPVDIQREYMLKFVH